jgi:very-short-patch-repair endonuclease
VDISQGADALSEIDFARLCRRHGLPAPQRQAVRRERSGRRRYLDASWRRRDGRLVVAEVDGALHLDQRRWWDDQARQNELVLADAVVLRFPSVVVRTDEHYVAGQLRRALRL